LRGEPLHPVDTRFEVIDSKRHGDVEAVRIVMRRVGFDALIASRPSRERDVVCAMVAARILAPHTKLATTRWWHTTTLAEAFGVQDADEDELYAAMDWVLARQPMIEKKLAARHLDIGALVLYDLSSSYFEGTTCPLAKLGYSRDGKPNKLQVNYGLVTNVGGCPVAVSVFDGNTADSATFLPHVKRLRTAFGIDTLVMVGDRGMISQKAIDALHDVDGVAWITALKSPQIRALVDGGSLQLGLFDHRNLVEFTHPDFPGERLVACRNPQLGELRAQKRRALLEATRIELEKVAAMVARGRLRGRDAIGVRVGRVVNKYKVAKHFGLEIDDTAFTFRIREAQVAQEAALDGVYILRTPIPAPQMAAADVVRSYKSLSTVERAFRSLKTVDLKVRPIHHRLADRVRSHVFLCVLAYYVEWHMREAWRPLLFADEDQDAKSRRDPVAPAKRSADAERKALTHTLPDGTPAHSFRTLLEELSTIVRSVCRAPAAAEGAPTFTLVTRPKPKQQQAFDLLEAIPV
jgi:hypothetical protein